MSEMAQSLVDSPIVTFSEDERAIDGDRVPRLAGGTPFNPHTGEDLTEDEIQRLKDGHSLVPEDEPPCWASDKWVADATDDDALILAKPSTTRLHAPEYVLRPLLPRKSVALIAADSGTGKSTWCAHIEALASRGELDEGRPLRVLVVTTEDSADDIAAQYAVEDANTDNIRTISRESLKLFSDDGAPALKTLGPSELKRIIDVAYKVRPDIIRFDPLHRFASGDWNNAKSTEFVDELTVLAQSLNCVVLGVMHTNKGAMVAREAITGSGQWVAKARSAAVMAAPDDDKNHCILQQVKANRSDTQNYEIEYASKPVEFDDGSTFEVRYVASMTPTTRTADEVFAQNAADRAAFVDRDELSDMARWLYDTIAARGGHVFANDLFKLAENRPERWTRGQIRRAKKEAGITDTRQSCQRARSIWYLPSHCTENEAKMWGTIPEPQEGDPKNHAEYNV